MTFPTLSAEIACRCGWASIGVAEAVAVVLDFTASMTISRKTWRHSRKRAGVFIPAYERGFQLYVCIYCNCEVHTHTPKINHTRAHTPASTGFETLPWKKSYSTR